MLESLYVYRVVGAWQFLGQWVHLAEPWFLVPLVLARLFALGFAFVDEANSDRYHKGAALWADRRLKPLRSWAPPLARHLWPRWTWPLALLILVGFVGDVSGNGLLLGLGVATMAGVILMVMLLFSAATVKAVASEIRNG